MPKSTMRPALWRSSALCSDIVAPTGRFRFSLFLHHDAFVLRFLQLWRCGHALKTCLRGLDRGPMFLIAKVVKGCAFFVQRRVTRWPMEKGGVAVGLAAIGVGGAAFLFSAQHVLTGPMNFIERHLG